MFDAEKSGLFCILSGAGVAGGFYVRVLSVLCVCAGVVKNHNVVVQRGMCTVVRSLACSYYFSHYQVGFSHTCARCCCGTVGGVGSYG